MTQPAFAGIHHLKFNVADLGRSLAFYEAAFGAQRVVGHDHRKPTGELFAYILKLDGLGTFLELRLNPEAAQRERGSDPITLSVEKRADLDIWRAHFETIGAKHSPILTGLVGWLLAVEDPDGRRVRLYTLETHGPELPYSVDPNWL